MSEQFDLFYRLILITVKLLQVTLQYHLDRVIEIKNGKAFKGSNGLMDKVSASQPQDRGFEPYTWVTVMIPHMTPVLDGSRKQAQECLI